MERKYDRRDFLKLSAAMTVGGISLAGCSSLPKRNLSTKSVPPIETVRAGIIGLGNRGKSLLEELLKFDRVEVRAVCDIIEHKVESAQQTVFASSGHRPAGYYRSETDYKRLYARDDIDLVVIATPWNWHAPMCVEAMQAGKHAATEVPAAVTVEECWQLVETSEKTGRYCTMLENCCYGRSEMMVLNMVRKGLFGELIHAECGYIHDRRSRILSDFYEGMWHLKNETKYTGNTYPTHGLGPVAQYMNINRGDRFDYMVSVSNHPKGLKAYAAEHFGPDHEFANLKYTVGDVNVSMIKTISGKTITLYFNWANPRPYSRINLVQGIKGIFRSWPDRIWIEGRTEGRELEPSEPKWESVEPYIAEYEHPLWKSLLEKAESGGHGGMDYVMTYRLINALQTGTPPDIDVYDAASWSVVFPLSSRSTAKRGRSVDFPDFTRHAWKTNHPLPILQA